jgi:hypothetical protein
MRSKGTQQFLVTAILVGAVAAASLADAAWKRMPASGCEADVNPFTPKFSNSVWHMCSGGGGLVGTYSTVICPLPDEEPGLRSSGLTYTINAHVKDMSSVGRAEMSLVTKYFDRVGVSRTFMDDSGPNSNQCTGTGDCWLTKTVSIPDNGGFHTIEVEHVQDDTSNGCSELYGLYMGN